ncbi:glycoside hydrolase family 38 C-terminal domain-containing protein [Granulicoccus phenolivorans]|uniref:glycoside hydrolase family 38 C-terminal domain-containing protein n=1 Tax=Granulicoccus phenolivorans TaxID=266854 RepID=UPI0003FEDA74|nr:glycoside hydrolase family 38 C-terminal domain-containing protein [Granulicoccus phenolivorans]
MSETQSHAEYWRQFVNAHLTADDAETRGLALDILALAAQLDVLHEADPRWQQVGTGLGQAKQAIETPSAGSAGIARMALAPLLGARAYPGTPVRHSFAYRSIDTGWSRTGEAAVRHSLEAVAETVDLVERTPGLTVLIDNVQALDWAGLDSALARRLHDLVGKGRIIPGSTWVGADQTLASAESLSRQFLAAASWAGELAGGDEVWLNPAGGFSPGYPAIARAAGKQNVLGLATAGWIDGADGTRLVSVQTVRPQTVVELAAETSADLVAYAAVPDVAGLAQRWADLEGRSPRLLPSRPDVAAVSARLGLAETDLATPCELTVPARPGPWAGQRARAWNRRCESLLREAELWSTAATVQRDFPYPDQALDRLWRTVLRLQQPADRAEGADPAAVADADRAYARTVSELETLIATATQALVGAGGAKILLNASPFRERGVAAYAAGRGEPVDDHEVEVAGSHYRLAQGRWAVRLDLAGQLTSARWAGRELLAAAPGLVLVDPADPSRRTPVTEIDKLGNTREHVSVERRFGDSWVGETYRLTDDRLEIQFDIDWHEPAELRFDLPLDLHTTSAATECGFGFVTHPTRATAGDPDATQYPTGRWVHVAETGFGVALANDSTYSHRIQRQGHRTVVSPILLGPADQGRHRLRFALTTGGVDAAIRAGYLLNLGHRIIRGGQDVPPVVEVVGEGVAVEAIKMAADGSGDVIIRLYEACGGRARGSVEVGFLADAIGRCDTLERPIGDPVEGTAHLLDLRPFEVMTLRAYR